MPLVISQGLYDTLKCLLIAPGRKAELLQLPYADGGRQRSDIILRCGGVSICYAGRKEGERAESSAMYRSAERPVHLG